jgi:endonuclease/exonuclease/phosphatase family metal-dependent hydrolase
MKHILPFLAMLLCLSVVHPTQARRKQSLRLTSYNIHHGLGMDDSLDFRRIANLFKEAKSDVIAVQEVDSATQRIQNRYSLGELAQHCNMHALFAPAISFQGGKYGVGILCKRKPLSWHYIPLPGAEEARVLLVAEFKHYVVACTHLSLTERDLLESIPLIVIEARKWQKPFILMRDLNADPQSEFYRVMSKHFTFLNRPDEPTFPSQRPTICIDHIAVFNANADRVLKSETHVGHSLASDHCPLHARLRITH